MIEVWGGMECTVNRIGNAFHDQLERTGHEGRDDDLKRIADLGIQKVRFPILWERCVKSAGAPADWTWVDRRMELLKRLALHPIVGLLHHGSGPRDTSLIDESFAPRFAEFAAAFAERFPWVEDYTPINEPLTTARFSGLYGFWYPHHCSNESFLRMLLNECEAIRLAMKAVRAVNPEARLVQTEDLGKIFSTPFLRYQADFENERRWLSFDLLCGRVNEDHPLWDFCTQDIDAERLLSFQDDPCRPDLIGINHYITSNRFLDERRERYPSHVHGSNGRHRYADIEAVRVGAETVVGPKELLREAWDRYQIPLAVTEAHLSCTREEQMRWLHDIWKACNELRESGVDVRAMTAWSIFGAYDWDSLITEPRGHYESGVFDLRSPEPRPTALASMLKALAKEKRYDHPVLDGAGWWHRPDRLLYPSVNLGLGHRVHKTTPRMKRPILITGASGMLATALAYSCDRRGLDFRLVSRKDIELSDKDRLRDYLRQLKPWAIINAAGFNRIDQSEVTPELCVRDNVEAPVALARFCLENGLRFVTISSDQVFDGSKTEPYLEWDLPDPVNTYGRAKFLCEQEILKISDQALIVRSGCFFGPWDESNFLTRSLRTIARDLSLRAPGDIILSPTYLPHFCQALLDLLIDDERGIWHLANSGVVSLAELVRMGAWRFGLDARRIQSKTAEEMQFLAKRPKFCALGSQRGQLLPSLEVAIDNYCGDCRVDLS